MWRSLAARSRPRDPGDGASPRSSRANGSLDPIRAQRDQNSGVSRTTPQAREIHDRSSSTISMSWPFSIAKLY